MSLVTKFKQYPALFSSISDEKLGKMDQHFELLKEWNQKIALVSRKSIEESFAPHYADSVLALLKTVPLSDAAGSYYDIGSGAGFPGILFAILYPERKIALFEKSLKKQMFLNVVVQQLELTNAEIRGLLDNEELRGMVTARAVFPEDRFFKFFHRNLAVGAKVVRNLGGEAVSTFPKSFKKLFSDTYELPEGFGKRTVEVFEKCST